MEHTRRKPTPRSYPSYNTKPAPQLPQPEIPTPLPLHQLSVQTLQRPHAQSSHSLPHIMPTPPENTTKKQRLGGIPQCRPGPRNLHQNPNYFHCCPNHDGTSNNQLIEGDEFHARSGPRQAMQAIRRSVTVGDSPYRPLPYMRLRPRRKERLLSTAADSAQSF
jgi:hypothetical protein